MKEVPFEQFAALDIRIGTVVAAEAVEGSDKLIKCTVDLGEEEPRTIVSGLRPAVTPEELVGKQFPYLLNIPPRTIFGIESHGMILATKTDEGVALLQPTRPVPPGSPLH